MAPIPRFGSPTAQASDPASLQRLFGTTDLLPLWIAEPSVELSAELRATVQARATLGWYGYEIRPAALAEAFWAWSRARHGWSGDGLTTLVSPSVGTTIGVLIDRLTSVGDHVIIQPPVFTDFKPLIASANRVVARNPLRLTEDGYRMDVDALAQAAADPGVTLMILCNPHNPVGRQWSMAELRTVAEICAANDVVVLADEIHADLALRPHAFTPFAEAAVGTGVRWAAAHGPIKTFGLAGVCDTLLITDDERVAAEFQTMSDRLHLTRNNVFGLAAFEAAYQQAGGWLDGLLELVAANIARLEEGLAGGLRLVRPEATYLAWLDLRALGLDVPELTRWIGECGVAMSPGHWFGREGAGFARLTIAADEAVIAEAIDRLNAAV